MSNDRTAAPSYLSRDEWIEMHAGDEPSPTATDVIRAVDQLRRDLSGYHGHLVSFEDQKRHVENQRKRIVQLEGLYEEKRLLADSLRMRLDDAQAENDKLHVLVGHMWGWLNAPSVGGSTLHDISGQMRELGIEV